MIPAVTLIALGGLATPSVRADRPLLSAGFTCRLPLNSILKERVLKEKIPDLSFSLSASRDATTTGASFLSGRDKLRENLPP
jgi:hypothetical protein